MTRGFSNRKPRRRGVYIVTSDLVAKAVDEYWRNASAQERSLINRNVVSERMRRVIRMIFGEVAIHQFDPKEGPEVSRAGGDAVSGD